MDDTILVLNKLLDISSLRQSVLSHNVANVNTPGFKRQDIVFRESLADAIKSGSSLGIEESPVTIEMDKDAPSRPDGNTVSMQDEMTEMAENGLLYRLSTQVIGKKFARLHSAIRGN